MEDLFGLAYLGLFGFAIWMWADALNRPGEVWTATTWTKKRWFLTWYVTGFLTFGLAPMGMAIYYYRTLRPVLRASNASTAPQRPGPPGQHQPDGSALGARETPPALRSQALPTTVPTTVPTAVPTTVEGAQDTFLARARSNAIASSDTPKRRPSLTPVAVLLGAALIAGAILLARSHSDRATAQDASLVAASQRPLYQTTQAPLPPPATDATTTAVPLSTVAPTPTQTQTQTQTTISIGRRAGDEMLAAVNRQGTALNAISLPPPGSGDAAWTSNYTASAAVFQRFVNDVVAITFPADMKADADQVIRDATNLIGTYQRAAAVGLSYEGATQISVAYDTLEGSEQVLGSDLANDR